MLQTLTNDDRHSTGACDHVGNADVLSCMKVAAMPTFDFGARTAAAAAARTVMTNSSSLASGVNVMTSTIHYLSGTSTGSGSGADQATGTWTTVLDGSGTRSMEGVAVWNGQSNTASICEFQGDDSFDRAFGSIAGNSLRNLLA